MNDWDKSEDEDDLYNFDDAPAYNAPAVQEGGMAPVGGIPSTAAAARPMTAVTSAGFGNTRPNSGGRAMTTSTPDLNAEESDEPEALSAKKEQEISDLILKSARLRREGDLKGALDLAKSAAKKERTLATLRTNNGLEQLLPFKFYVLLHLAKILEENGKMDDAISTYQQLIKNKQYPVPGRVRVNMGNIYFAQKDFPNAIKNYHMALDQIPRSLDEVRFAIMRNVGNSWVALGRYPDAINSYEAAMDGEPDFRTGFNLILCYFAIGNKEKMRDGFRRLLDVRPLGSAAPVDEDELPALNNSADGDDDSDSPLAASDKLKEVLRSRDDLAERIIVMAAKLIAPEIEPDPLDGFEFVLELLRTSPLYAKVAKDVEIAKALSFLKSKDFDLAIETLKGFEGKDAALASTAATNLSFLYFLEHDFASAAKHSALALEADHYNARALVNQANCLYVQKEYEKARDIYTEAISVEADCTEAVYNLGLVCKELGDLERAYEAFEKLDSITPNSPEVIFNLATICELWDDLDRARHWYERLRTIVPTDPTVLARLGQVYEREGDKSAAFNCFQQSYRYYPSNMLTLKWLGAACVENKVYDEAIKYFKRGAQLQPNQIKWRLMMASCYRRMGQYQKALGTYEAIHAEFPNDMESIRYLARICRDLGRDDEAADYERKLRLLEKARGGGGGGGGGRGRDDDDDDFGGGGKAQAAPRQRPPSNYSSEVPKVDMPDDPEVDTNYRPNVSEAPTRKRMTDVAQDPESESDNDDIDDMLPGM